MAKISLYQQQRLASSVQNPGGIDMSGTAMSNAIAGSTNQLASIVQQAQGAAQSDLNQMLASSVGNLGGAINHNIQQNNKRKAELARDAEQDARQKQEFRDDIFTANMQKGVTGVLDDHLRESKEKFKNTDPKQASKYFTGTIDKKLENFYKQNPALEGNDKVKTALTVYANNTITQHRRHLDTFGEKQSDINTAIQTNSVSDEIAAEAGVKAPPGLSPIGEPALMNGLNNLLGRLPAHAASEGLPQAEKNINGKALNLVKNWYGANVENSKDLRLAQDMIEATDRNGGTPRITQLGVKGIDQNLLSDFKKQLDARVAKYNTGLKQDEQIITTQDKLDVSFLVGPVKHDVEGNYNPQQLQPILKSLMAGREALKNRPVQIKGIMGDTLNNPTIQPALDEYDSAIVLVNTKISDYKKEQDRIAKEGLSDAEKLNKEQQAVAWDAFHASPKAQSALMAVDTSFIALSAMKITGGEKELDYINAAREALVQAGPYMRDKQTGTPNADYLQKQALVRAKLNMFSTMTPDKVNVWLGGMGGDKNPAINKVNDYSKQLNQGASDAAKAAFPPGYHPSVNAYVNNSVAEKVAKFKEVSGMEPDAHTLAGMQAIANIETTKLPKGETVGRNAKTGKVSKEQAAELEKANANFIKNQKGKMAPAPPPNVKSYPAVSDMHYVKPGVSAKRIAELKAEGILE